MSASIQMKVAIKRLIKQQLSRISRVRELIQAREWVGFAPEYARPGLAVSGRNLEFMRDVAFITACRRGVSSGHRFVSESSGARPEDLGIEWQVHVACWAAWHARHLPGDFVECGVNTGILSLAICDFIDFNSTGKDFFLFDTFAGIPESQMGENERAARLIDNQQFYRECYEIAAANFAPYPRARLVRGIVPDSLRSVRIDRVCYLSLDMNIVKPEIEALGYLWDRLSRGAPILLDDYGYQKYEAQKQAMDAFARQRGLRILTLPTGQGLLLKP